MATITVDQGVDLKNKFLLIFGKGISLIGGRIYDFAIAFFILKITGSSVAFATSCILIYLPQVLFAPVAGFLVDRYSRKSIIVIADISAAAVLIILFVLISGIGFHIYLLFASIFLLSIIETAFSISFEALIPVIVRKEQLKQIYSLNQSVSSIANIASPLIGGIIIQFLSLETFILINAGSFLFSAICEFFIVTESENKSNTHIKKTEKKESKFIDTFRYILKKPVLLKVIIVELILNSLIHLSFSVPFPYLLVNVYNFESHFFGIIRAFPSVGALCVSFYYSLKKEKFSEIKFPTIPILLFAFYFLGLTVFCTDYLLNINIALLVILFSIHSLCLGILIVSIDIPLKILRQNHTDDENRGKVFAVAKILTNCSIPVMYLLSGVIIKEAGIIFLPAFAFISLIIYLVINSRYSKAKP